MKLAVEDKKDGKCFPYMILLAQPETREFWVEDEPIV